METLLARVAAVVGPALVFTAAVSALLGYRDAEDVQAAENAGRVVNSRVFDVDVATAMDAILAERLPEVVVLGPSYANTDIKLDLLAAQLGVSNDDIVLLSVPNSVGAHWYAMLKYRVFASGHHPRLVVVVSGLQSMLLTTPLTESSMVNLEVQLPPEGDPVVDSLVQMPHGYGIARLREQRGKVRQALFDRLRALPARALFRVDPARARVALEHVFDDARIDMSLHGSSSPVAFASAEVDRFYTPDLLPLPADSFLAPITELVREEGARIVWVRPPMSPFIPVHLDDVVLDGVQEQAIALVEQGGGAYLDMRALPMSSQMFKNEDHMNSEGSRRFTEALGKALLDLDALQPAADPTRVGPLGFTVESSPSTPDGTIPPGGSRTWTVAEWDERRGSFAVDVVTAQPDGTPARVRVGGVTGPLAPLGGSRSRATLRPPSPGPAPFEVVVEVPPDGAPLSVVALALGQRLGRQFLVGDEVGLEGRTVETIGVGRLVGGVLVDESVHPTYARPPLKPPLYDRPLLDLPDEVAAYETERWSFLSDEALRGETDFGSRCSPLRILEDGELLGPANVPCGEVKHKGHGRSCHTTDRIFLTAPDGSDPARNGRTYRLALDPGRKCDAAAWIYPKDQLVVQFPTERVAELSEGAAYLRVVARYLNHRPATSTLRLRVDGAVVLEEELDGREVDKGPIDRELPFRLAPGPHDVRFEWESHDHVFYLLSQVSLGERPPADAPAR
jgi:hypothetical protein